MSQTSDGEICLSDLCPGAAGGGSPQSYFAPFPLGTGCEGFEYGFVS